MCKGKTKVAMYFIIIKKYNVLKKKKKKKRGEIAVQHTNSKRFVLVIAIFI